MFSTLYAPLITFGISMIALVFLTKGKMTHLALDQPNERSLHQTPVPRTGGIAIMAGIMAGWSLLGAPSWPVWLGLTILILVSFLDDLYNIPVPLRFGTHFLGSLIFSASVLANSYLSILAATIVFVWMINLYNFMDGSDGLAGGMALFGFGFYALAAWVNKDMNFALLNMTIAASAGAFLFFNFHPARIFMGDAGSIPLGFLSASFGLMGWQRTDWPIWFPIMIFSPFIVDSTITLLKRLFKGEKIWKAHKEHYYQRLIRMGLGHRNLALLEYALMISVGISSLFAIHGSGVSQIAVFAGWGAAFIMIMHRIDKRWAGKN